MDLSRIIESLSLEKLEERIYPPEVRKRLDEWWPRIVPRNDPFGFEPDVARKALVITYAIYRYYFRTEAFGRENIPDEPVLVVSNHSGQLPFDGMALVTDFLVGKEPPALLRSMVDWSVPAMPFISVLYARIGQVVGRPENAVRLLKNGGSLLVFPEGVRGISKPFTRRYRLEQFGTGFLRVALKAGVPVVPAAVIGAEEQAPGFDFKPLARLLGVPAFPITPIPPFIPLVPLPVKYRIYYGTPLRFGGSSTASEAELRPMAQQVRAQVASLIARGLRERDSIF